MRWNGINESMKTIISALLVLLFIVLVARDDMSASSADSAFLIAAVSDALPSTVLVFAAAAALTVDGIIKKDTF